MLKEKFSGLKSIISSMPYWQIALIVVVGATAVGGLAILSLSSRSNRGVIITKEVREEQPSPQIVVHMAGAVVRPGLYFMEEGSRLGDALEMCGGPLPDADIDALNLAEKLRDGQKIYVPLKGAGLPSGSAPPTSSDKVNINLATQKELEELPGIGPTLAKSIIDYREKNGGFKSVEELKKVKGIGEKRFEEIRDKVTI
jgi:competence protein ComEA